MHYKTPMNDDATPRYRINAVSDMTGVPSPTLRAWERRYGVPAPGRTAKGYRLYSALDVETITRMRDLLESGMSASDAARVTNETLTAAAPAESSDADVDVFDAIRERIVAAAMAADPAQLDDQIRRAMILGSAASIFDRVFAPALREIGDAWHRGDLSVGQEHMATQAISAATHSLLRLVQPASSPRTAVLACFEHEIHELPLMGVTFHLAAWGYRCIFLGARTPPDALAAVVAKIKPDLVGLSCTITPNADAIDRIVAGYADAVGDAGWAVGGAGALDMKDQLEAAGAVVFQGDLEELRRALAVQGRAGNE